MFHLKGCVSVTSARLFSVIVIMAILLSSCSSKKESSPFAHPIKNPPAFTRHVRCDNCGMDRNKFARTRYVFDTEKGRFYTCSIACLVVLCMKKNVSPRNVKVAEYLRPTSMIDAEKAVFVIGSKAKGTMTKVSKIAFSDRQKAIRFTKKYGGTIATFQDALEIAKEEVLRGLRK